MANPNESTDPLSGAAEKNPGGSRLMGRYEILGRLGEGGMGTVYKAWDPELTRLVAVKVPHLDGHGQRKEAAVQRFLREARAAAQVHHPNVCPIHDSGLHDDAPYAVMKYIEGTSLAELIKNRRLNVYEAVALIRKVARGLEAVHANNIVHRDLKPGNILLDKKGEPHLTDFGLARSISASDFMTKITQTGAIVGTPAYMPPEQAQGDAQRVGPWTDIYSLGVVLYQLLAGRLPFEGSVASVLKQIADKSPPAPSRFQPDLDKGLEAIVLKSLECQPEDRFQSAAAFADALDEWSAARLGHRLPPTVTMAKAAATSAETRKPPRRRAKLAGLVAIAILVVGGVLLLTLCLPYFANEQGDRPEKEAARDDGKGSKTAPSGLHLPKHAGTTADEPVKEGEYLRFDAHKTPVGCVAFSRDGKSVFSGGGDVKDAVGKNLIPFDCRLLRWNAQTGEKISDWNYPSPVRCLAVASDGLTILAGAAWYDSRAFPARAIPTTLHLKSAATGEEMFQAKIELNSLGFAFPMSAVAFLPDKRQVLADTGNGGVRRYHLESKQEFAHLKPVYSHSYDYHLNVIAIA